MMLDFRRIEGVYTSLGESPLWDENRQRLFFTDIDQHIVYSCDADGGQMRSRRFASHTGSLAMAKDGRLVIALRNEIILWSPETDGVSTLACAHDFPAHVRFNDGKAGPDGAFWCGTMDMNPERAPIGALFRITADGGINQVLDGVRISNGIDWSPDGSQFYFADTRGIWIDVFDFDAANGQISNRRRFASPDESTGLPDGAAMDTDGHYWSAGATAGRLNRFAPDGTLSAQFPVPAPAPTMPAFGGAGMNRLFVTSLDRKKNPDGANDGHGILMYADTSFRGARLWRFG